MSQQINLYEARLRPSHDPATWRNLGIASLVLLLAMTTLSLWAGAEARRQVEMADAAQRQVADAQLRLADLGKAIAQRRVSPALMAEVEGTKSLLADRQEVLGVLGSGELGNTSGFSAVMTGFARQTQAGLWLTGFVLGAGGENVEIRGRLLDAAGLPAYVERLSTEPVFQGWRFAALEMRAGNPETRAEPAGQPAFAAPEPHTELLLPRFVEFVLRSEKAGVDVLPTGRAR